MKAELISVFGDDLMVANVARVSMGKFHETFNEETDTKLIKYLATHNHWSPFSHPKIQFRLYLPIFCARQWEKHRIGCVRGYDIYDQNEISRRYVDDEPEFFIPEEWRSRPNGSIKQGSGEILNEYISASCFFDLERIHELSLDIYNSLLSYGVAPEQARMVLPQSMYTQWIETGSLIYWSRLCNLRIDNHAQKEIRVLAEQVSNQIAEKFPVSWKYLTDMDE